MEFVRRQDVQEDRSGMEQYATVRLVITGMEVFVYCVLMVKYGTPDPEHVDAILDLPGMGTFVKSV